jgi:uncharacterized membrane protein YedE/YeeE
MSASTCGLRCRIMALAVPAGAGLVVGVGLAVSGMTRPERVIGFLDPLGAWDPSLAFVLAAAVLVYAIAYRVIMRRRQDPWFDLRFHVPARRDIDLPLVAGAALFGIGWGLGGLCPGPAIVAAASGLSSALLFVAAMLAGMFVHDRIRR